MLLKTVALKINNRSYSFCEALTIFQASLQKNIYIPRFCYHVALKIAGNCRMCLVEEKSSLKPVASCAVTIVSGMSIFTKTELVKKAREGVIEYLLINHPLDCPICDQGGECDLQDQTMVFGADRGRFYGVKRSTPNKNLGFFVKTFLNRCIHCARCTRFLQDLAGTQGLGLLGRGYKTEISPYTKFFLKSEVSGNIIDLCPVGALTSKPYAFRARPWELVSVNTFDIVEPFGSNIEINYRGLEVLRILPRVNYEINAEWISDKTRFYYDAFSIQRLTSPFYMKKGKYTLINWLQFFTLWRNLGVCCLVRDLVDDFIPNMLLTYGFGEYADLESMVALKYLHNCLSGSNGLVSHFDSGVSLYGNDSALIFKENPLVRVVVINSVNVRYESPILNIKLRVLTAEHDTRVVNIGFLANLNYEFQHLNLLLSPSVLVWFGFLASTKGIFFITGMKDLPGADQFPTYKVGASVGEISFFEVFSKDFLERATAGLKFYLGQPDKKLFKLSSADFVVSAVHHVEDAFWGFFKFLAGAKLPSKFYLEKVGSYYNESGYFFSTLTNIFGYSIRGTKEDWKICLALAEKLGFPLRQDKTVFNSYSMKDFGRDKVFNFKKTPEKNLQEFSNKLFNSKVNNYYEKGLLSRVSPILSLCSKLYTLKNDYKYVLNI